MKRVAFEAVMQAPPARFGLECRDLGVDLVEVRRDLRELRVEPGELILSHAGLRLDQLRQRLGVGEQGCVFGTSGLGIRTGLFGIG